ncbi:hypothetical protein B0I37DRAFT_365282 [Chaetomium sp. MPI-CAGE-AT-0009]|nr:hypothetical protein B0I37DRAFT_365282 [Chaetomium sp. MPI-CAGE-AT-0009]
MTSSWPLDSLALLLLISGCLRQESGVIMISEGSPRCLVGYLTNPPHHHGADLLRLLAPAWLRDVAGGPRWPAIVGARLMAAFTVGALVGFRDDGVLGRGSHCRRSLGSGDGSAFVRRCVWVYVRTCMCVCNRHESAR